MSESLGRAVVNADRFDVVSMSKWMSVLIACRTWATKGLWIVMGRWSSSTSWMLASREVTAAGGREKSVKVGMLTPAVSCVGGVVVVMIASVAVSGCEGSSLKVLKENGLIF